MASAQELAPARAYVFYVASESADEVARLRFEPAARALVVEKVIPVGFLPTEVDGPHGIAVAPDGRHWYATLAHGLPFGWLVKYAAGPDTLEGRVPLGMFPSTLAVAPFGDLAVAVNSDFHGEHRPSTVSIVDVRTMSEVARPTSCTMPHGSRFHPDGVRHYSTCMVDDQLVETDLRGLRVVRRLDVGPAARPVAAAAEGGAHGAPVCSPTWAQPSPDGRRVYVACNRSDELVEVDVNAWRVTRRWPAPRGPYNLDVTPDGRRLLVTQKQGGELTVWDVAASEPRLLARLPTSRRVSHGVAATPDGRYAFVTAEGVGGEPGAVDVVDLGRLEIVASAAVGAQAGGVAIWKVVR